MNPITRLLRGLATTRTLIESTLTRPHCAACDTLLRREAVFCHHCKSSVVVTTANTTSFGHYGGSLAIAIRRFKYHRRPDLARPLGHLLARIGPNNIDRVVPVPLHATRLVERGYNQAALLARTWGRIRGVPVDYRALMRIRQTPSQADLGRKARQHNLEGAFALRDPNRLRDCRVLLIDDVRTTGATLHACIRAMTGTAHVDVAVLAEQAPP